MSAFLPRFWAYQMERFPIPVLLCTTFAVVLSSSTIVHPTQIEWVPIFLATLLGLLQLFHIRVIDERRDFHHDHLFHADRPVQQGMISLAELEWMDCWGVALFTLITVLSSMTACVFGLIALLFSFLAGKEFFLGEAFRKNFFVYNAVNLLQMLCLQLLIYAILNPSFDLHGLLLWAHFLFAFSNSILLEIVRKIRIPTQESRGKDTYSWHMGFTGSLLFFLGATCLNGGLFIWTVSLLHNWQPVPLLLSGLVTVLLCLAIALHGLFRRKKTEYGFLGATLLSYLTLHFAVFLL